ncbi:5229_t:CDS:2, partial [Rhizophagus irregularis]
IFQKNVKDLLAYFHSRILKMEINASYNFFLRLNIFDLENK